MRITLLIVLVYAVIATPAKAAEDGFFLGAGMATANLDDRGLDDRDYAYHIAGGWQFSRYFAIEAGYLELGEFSGDSSGAAPVGTVIEADVSALTAKARLTVPVGRSFEIFADAGVLFWDAKWQEVTPGGGTVSLSQLSVQDDGADYVWGAGAVFRFTERVSLSGGWDHYKAGNFDVDAIGVDLYIRF